MSDVSITPNPALYAALSAHPKVNSVREASQAAALSWNGRSIFTGLPETELRGLIELIDNNPLVCARDFTLPGGGATLALLALGPLADAGLIAERPAMLTNAATSEEDVSPYLSDLGWKEGLTVSVEEADLEGAVAATVICAVRTPERLEDIDDLFEERYGRSFFVREDKGSEWHVRLVLGTPYSVYRLRITPDRPHSLLTVQVMAHQDGKCGAAQIVHAFNVMCGFEESLGLAP